jgi:PAS domain S-box-containing protein
MALQTYDIRTPEGGFVERDWDPLNSPVLDESGAVINIIHRVEDVTDQVRSGARIRQLESDMTRESAARAEEARARRAIETILERITDAFYALDRDWRFTYVNSRAEQIIRRRRRDLIGATIWDRFPDTVGTAFEAEFRKAMQTQRPTTFEAFFDRLSTWVEVHAYPSGEGLSIFFRDISRRKAAEIKLRDSEERYRLLVDMIPQNVWTTDARGSHTYFSKGWYDYSGGTPDSSHGEGWLAWVHPDDRDRTLARWKQSLRTGEDYNIEYRFRGLDGNYHWFLGQARALRGEHGEILEWFGTATDISERKRQEEEIARVTESRNRLMRGFSHDVKNPLGAADGFAALLEEGIGGTLSEEQLRSVHRIRKGIQESLHLINDLLELARTEQGQVALDFESLDAAALAREVADNFRAQVENAGLALHVNAGTPLMLRSDPVRARQIFSNLVSNAVKYTTAGRIAVCAERVTSGGPGPGAWAALRVADTGPGIPEDKRRAIFQEFTRLDPKAQHGAGVGLAISRRLACLLGGDITLESRTGEGSTFTFWLPTIE